MTLLEAPPLNRKAKPETGATPGPSLRLTSPDGQISLRLFPRSGDYCLTVALRGAAVLELSPLRLSLDGREVVSDGATTLGEPELYWVREEYPIRGVHSRAVHDAHGARIPLWRDGTAAVTLELRAANDGVAFRFLVPDAAGRPRVPDEDTSFVLPPGSTVWHHGLRGHYEGEYAEQDAGDVPAETWVAPPMTYRLPDGAGYASITEAALIDYSGMALLADGERGFHVRLGHAHPASYPYELRYGLDEAERLSRPAALTGSITTPWRVVLIGADLDALVNSDLVTSLSLPPDPRLFPEGLVTDWIKPGRAVWEYLDGRVSTAEEMREYCRLAGELGFEHNVLEGFWEAWSDDALRDLTAYGRERGVGIWLWKHRKELRDAAARSAFFRRCRDVGAVGVKIDFFDHEAKEVVDLYRTLLREAAEHRLLVNFHGSNKPTGETRTWPNELTREAVRGMEASRLTERARHECLLPFTRLLAGPADYTPLHFGARRADCTVAHQIASAAILTSPLLTFAASPRRITEHPAAKIIRSIPAVWDETRVLPPSEIGGMAVFARRSGDVWFLAAMSGVPARQTVAVPLTFLGGDGDCHALAVRDDLAAADPAAVVIEEAVFGAADTVTLELAPGGGCLARFTPVPADERTAE